MELAPSGAFFGFKVEKLNFEIEKSLFVRIKINLSESGYRHAIDPFLLSDFSSIDNGSKVADLGTATGIIPLVLNAMNKGERYLGVEIQPDLAAQARENVELNNLDDYVEIINADIRHICKEKHLPHESCDAVISNPPYRKVNSGKVAPNDTRAACRHELHGDIDDFISAAFYLLRNKGRFSLVYLPERLPELFGVMRNNKIEPKRMRMVHSRAGDDAILVLVEGRKNSKPGLVVEAPLYIYEGDEYSQEVRSIFGMD